MSISCKEFYGYDEKDRLDVLSKAFLVATKKDEHFYCELYQADGMYIEVTRSLHHEVKKQVKAFTNTDLLLPYLEEINLKIEGVF